jgi:putative restriction endonuclease
MMPPSAEHWLERLTHLRVDGGAVDPAPHKPLLLLVMLDLAKQDSLADTVELTPQLAFRFFSYWSIVAHRRSQKPDIRLPFYHLQGDGIWTALSAALDPLPDKGARMQARFVRFGSEIYQLFHDAVWRERAIRILIASYFEQQERVELYTLAGLPVPLEEEIVRDANYQAPDRPPVKAREVRFRLDVVAAYNYTCALTRYRLITVDTGSIVDAAHIHQFAESGNNDIRNGLGLSKNAHWLFDNGLWSLTNDYQVMVAAGHFDEENLGQNAPLLASYDGQRIHLPADQSLWPHPDHLDWHRRNRFRGRKRQ